MIATKDMNVGQMLPPVQKDVTFENIRLFSMWSNRNIHTDWEIAIKGGLPVMGFPVIIVGGIYAGYLSPTEAAAASVFYALFLEAIIYKSLTFSRIVDAFLQTGVITGVVFILVGAGQAFSWMIGFMQIPQQILPPLFGPDPSMLRVMIIVVVVYFVACMFVDPIVAIFILSPIFQPYVVSAGVDPILLGTLVTLQAAIGSATPPFGCDIFTAQQLKGGKRVLGS